MKRILTLLIVPFSLINYGNCQTNEFDFRKTKWGMSIDDVIQSEKGNPYEIEKDPSATYLRFRNVTLTNITGYSSIFYKFTNNNLVSTTMILYMDFQGCNINCNNPLSLSTTISMIQNNYFTALMKKGFLPSYSWEAGTTRLFMDDERGRNPMTKPEVIEQAYLKLKNKGSYLAKEIECRLKSNKTSLLFVFLYQTTGEPYYSSSQECNSSVWKHIVRIEASANSGILEKDFKPDF